MIVISEVNIYLEWYLCFCFIFILHFTWFEHRISGL